MQFISEKVNQIKIALFKSDINSELLLPNNIIDVLQVDEDGHIWFYTSCNGRYARNISKSFFASLDFYKKGSECRLHLKGLARIVEDENDFFINRSNYSKSVRASLILLKMKTTQAEYYENSHINHISWKERLLYNFNHLFFSPGSKIFDFS
jgi:hypothetical protein